MPNIISATELSGDLDNKTNVAWAPAFPKSRERPKNAKKRKKDTLYRFLATAFSVRWSSTDRQRPLSDPFVPPSPTPTRGANSAFLKPLPFAFKNWAYRILGAHNFRGQTWQVPSKKVFSSVPHATSEDGDVSYLINRYRLYRASGVSEGKLCSR